MASQAPQNQHAPVAANFGLARPPAIYLTAIATGLVLHFACPTPFVPSLARLFGALIAVLAATLFIGVNDVATPPLSANESSNTTTSTIWRSLPNTQGGNRK
jgi:hypothetical protein